MCGPCPPNTPHYDSHHALQCILHLFCHNTTQEVVFHKTRHSLWTFKWTNVSDSCIIHRCKSKEEIQNVLCCIQIFFFFFFFFFPSQTQKEWGQILIVGACISLIKFSTYCFIQQCPDHLLLLCSVSIICMDKEYQVEYNQQIVGCYL